MMAGSSGPEASTPSLEKPTCHEESASISAAANPTRRSKRSLASR